MVNKSTFSSDVSVVNEGRQFLVVLPRQHRLLKVLFVLTMLWLANTHPIDSVQKQDTKKESPKKYVYNYDAVANLMGSELKSKIENRFERTKFVAPNMSIYSDVSDYDVVVYFESRGELNDIIIKDGRYPSVGPLQYNAAPKGMLDTFLKSPEVRKQFGVEIAGFGGIRAIQKRDEFAIEKLRALLRNPKFMSLYYKHAENEYSWWIDEFQNRSGINIRNRGQVAIGIIKTIINNRRNDIFLIGECMVSKNPIDKINKMSERNFITCLDEARKEVFEETLGDYSKKEFVLKNYESTFRHFMPHAGKIYKSKSDQVDMVAKSIENYLVNATDGVVPARFIQMLASVTVTANKCKISNRNITKSMLTIKKEFISTLVLCSVQQEQLKSKISIVAQKKFDVDYGIRKESENIKKAILPDPLKSDDTGIGLLARAEKIRHAMAREKSA